LTASPSLHSSHGKVPQAALMASCIAQWRRYHDPKPFPGSRAISFWYTAVMAVAATPTAMMISGSQSV